MGLGLAEEAGSVRTPGDADAGRDAVAGLQHVCEGAHGIPGGALVGRVIDRVPGYKVHVAAQIVAAQQHAQLLGLDPHGTLVSHHTVRA